MDGLPGHATPITAQCDEFPPSETSIGEHIDHCPVLAACRGVEALAGLDYLDALRARFSEERGKMVTSGEHAKDQVKSSTRNLLRFRSGLKSS